MTPPVPLPPRHRVIHTAQALVDLVVEVPELPARGENAVATLATEYAGGAVNVLVAAARSGADAVHAGAHGTGPHGDLIRSTLRAEGVAVSDTPVPDQDSGVCVVLVEPSAERTFVTTYGAERRLTTAGLDRSAPQAGDYLCLSGYSLHGPTTAPLMTWLDSLHDEVRVVLDPGAAFADLDPQLREQVLARTDIWTSNAQEARDLLQGSAGASAATGAAGVARLLPDSALIVVRDGPRGCEVHTGGPGGRSTHLPGFPQRPVDTNGAGDSHVGVMVAELAAGTTPVLAAYRANAAGAIKVTRRGPATAPTREEIDAFLSAQPGRDLATGAG